MNIVQDIISEAGKSILKNLELKSLACIGSSFPMYQLAGAEILVDFSIIVLAVKKTIMHLDLVVTDPVLFALLGND